ncbi:hypothetical protein D7U91_01435 [Stenotrophomonas maltophilia]|uniref:NIF family HAD-type phosphatase n=1 Tax=Stenotrophomonas maltophilia TaxID=40324 RepID=UPI0015DFA992|nr:NIF family HAD-type phosphatase [Stenotrophomonas maltophilia]MBA0386497.1 hypothetical protein [Stenotrophomonas maltophilia]MBA0391885.1 hypothetical protein [Stenotrophomonas maltophilia]MBA0464329.1 hypothetical protein [Stenotrophomonas maltophilia]MBA0471707.1 hypothetical protein [Stenotrophomonas maltophilia]
MRPTILALDLEGTLISNAVSQIPRPGLWNFLERAQASFQQLVMFTAVARPVARRVAALLSDEGFAPVWFRDIPCIDWTGSTKDLRFVSPILGETLLLDDQISYVREDQRAFWIEVPEFEPPYPPSDAGLEIALSRIEARVLQLVSPADQRTHDGPNKDI